ncbi:MAG: hypothetical protein P1U41_04925 [Vicingaceae bacterium]|nr:hypothetical protein [Vicingaceae bacterium]
MKALVVFFIFFGMYSLSAQTATQKFANQAGQNIVYTYDLKGISSSSNVISDDSLSSEILAVKNLKAQLETISGVRDVIYDNATNLISVTANLTAILPKQISVNKQSSNASH